MRKVTNFQKFFSEIKKSSGRRTFRKKKRCAPRGVITVCAGLLCLRERGAHKNFLPPTLGDMQAVRSTIAGFAEKGGDMQAVRSTIAGFAEKRKLAFSRENNGRSLQSKPNRYHQYENFLQTPLLYVLSFLKRKYERKQFEGHIPSKTPLKVQGGTFPTRQLYPSKGGSAVRILKYF